MVDLLEKARKIRQNFCLKPIKSLSFEQDVWAAVLAHSPGLGTFYLCALDRSRIYVCDREMNLQEEIVVSDSMQICSLVIDDQQTLFMLLRDEDLNYTLFSRTAQGLQSKEKLPFFEAPKMHYSSVRKKLYLFDQVTHEFCDYSQGLEAPLKHWLVDREDYRYAFLTLGRLDWLIDGPGDDDFRLFVYSNNGTCSLVSDMRTEPQDLKQLPGEGVRDVKRTDQAYWVLSNLGLSKYELDGQFVFREQKHFSQALSKNFTYSARFCLGQDDLGALLYCLCNRDKKIATFRI